MENFYNKVLKAKAWVWSKLPRTNKVHKAKPPKNYKQIFYDDFQKGLRANEWHIGARWGRFFIHRLDFYWDKSAITINKKGINLHVHLNPKTFIKKDLPKWEQHKSLPEQWTANYATGMISSNRVYGNNTWVEITVTLPQSEYQWSAFWTCGLSTWPPEIDVFEALTKDGAKDFKISPNIHYGKHTTEGHPSLGMDPIPLRKPFKREIQFAVHWTDDFVKFYYDGILVKKVTDKTILKYLEIPQYIILNNGYRDKLYREEASEEDLMFDTVASTLTVKEIKVFQKSV